MRHLFGFLCVCALGLMPLMGCSETSGEGGSGGAAGSGGMPECEAAEDCDDGNECTGNACVGAACEYAPVQDGTACDERNECNVGTCAEGTCDTTPVQDGTACGDGAGTCEAGSCVGRFACTEQGIRDAIAVGGGPHAFDCDGPQTIVTAAEIVIDNDVILDGWGNLAVDGNSLALPPDDQHIVFEVPSGVTAELRGLTVTGGACDEAPPCEEECYLLDCNASIEVSGTLTMADSTVSENEGRGIEVVGMLALTNSTVSENSDVGIHAPGTLTVANSSVSDNGFGGIVSGGSMTVTNSIVSRNSGTGIVGNGTWTVSDSTASDNLDHGIESGGGGVGTIENCTLSDGLVVWLSTLTVMNSTVSGNDRDSSAEISVREGGVTVTLTNSTVSRRDGGNAIEGTCGDWRLESRATIIEGVCDFPNCSVDPVWTSNGYNIESPGDTCGFDQTGDLVNITEGQLDLGELAANGGPTMTHALGAGSVAIDHIPAVDCGVTTDQRGEPRPETGGDACDVGSFERQPEDP